jgi:hypothetical protein
LIGSTLQWQIYGGGDAYNPGGTGVYTNGTFVDSDGVGGAFIEPGQMGGAPVTVFNIDATDTTITFDYSVTGATSPWSGSPSISLSPTIYTGIAINLLSAGSFTAVSIDPATNMAGFGTSDLSFTGSQIQVNFADLPFSTDTVVTLDVTTSGAASGAPEPGTVFLLPIAGVFLFRRIAFLRSRPQSVTG